MPSRIRRIVMTIVALLLAVAPVLGLPPGAPPPAAHAFEPKVHIAMFEATVGGQFSAEAQAAVAEGLDYSDSAEIAAGLNLLLKPFITIGPGQEHSEWHFDNAPNPEAICKLWYAHDPTKTGPSKPMGPDKLLVDAGAYAVEAFRTDPSDPPELDRVGTFRQLALFHYGQYLHAIQDFYSHTNWIELHATAGKQAGLAPIQAGCDPAALAAAVPAGSGRLQSGNFNLHAAKPDMCDYTIQWVFFLPRVVLPAGFDYCHGPPDSIPVWLAFGSTWLKPHQMLAKDSADDYHGGEDLILPDGSQTTYHQEARRLATLATPESFKVFRDRVVADLKKHLPQRDPECLFQVLLKGGDPACPLRTGLGSHYQGTLEVGDAQIAARFPHTFTEVRNVRAAIHLDLATNIVIGGSLSYEGLTPPAPSINEGPKRGVFSGVPIPNHGSFLVLAGGIIGSMAFQGESTTYDTDGSVVFSDTAAIVFVDFASDSTGQVALCTQGPSSWNPEQAERNRQRCVDDAFIVLQPVGAAPPVA